MSDKVGQILDLIGEFLTEKLQNELREQGHEATGSLINSIKHVKVGTSRVDIVTDKDYVSAMENGLPKGTSVPVDALIRWIEVKGIVQGDKEIRQVAWAIRTAIFKQGSPTSKPNKFNSKGAFSFTKNGRRIGFAEYVIDNYSKKIVEMAGTLMFQDIKNNLKQSVNEIK